MKSNELVWRTLLDAAISGTRSWTSLADLAFLSGVPVTTTHLATRRLSEIGAITQFRAGGFSVVSPYKILTLLCGWRNLSRDTMATTTKEALDQFVELGGFQIALGGKAAAAFHLGGNNVADFSEFIAYVPEALVQQINWPPGNQVKILQLDARAKVDWDGYSSVAQTYADLFATPGWQASEFRLALDEKYFSGRDWDQGRT